MVSVQWEGKAPQVVSSLGDERVLLSGLPGGEQSPNQSGAGDQPAGWLRPCEAPPHTMGEQGRAPRLGTGQQETTRRSQEATLRVGRLPTGSGLPTAWNKGHGENRVQATASRPGQAAAPSQDFSSQKIHFNNWTTVSQGTKCCLCDLERGTQRNQGPAWSKTCSCWIWSKPHCPSIRSSIR